MFAKILLATDGSAAAERAAEAAASLAAKYQSAVTVLHAYTPVPGFLGEPDYSRALYKTLEEANALVTQTAERLRALGAENVATEVIEGPPGNMILSVAETRQPDLIVLGARGLSAWQGIILGSVSMAVTQRAECPVLVVK